MCVCVCVCVCVKGQFHTDDKLHLNLNFFPITPGAGFVIFFASETLTTTHRLVWNERLPFEEVDDCVGLDGVVIHRLPLLPGQGQQLRLQEDQQHLPQTKVLNSSIVLNTAE